MRPARRIFAVAVIYVGAGIGGLLKADPEPAFALEPRGADQAQLPHTPIEVQLQTARPAWIRKEPVYWGTPKYAVFHLGNGPRSTYALALDEPADGDYRIYVDRNSDGDLTNDGDGAWLRKKPAAIHTYYGANYYALRASWGTAETESSFGNYSVVFYLFTNPDKLWMYGDAARVGSLTVDGTAHRTMLVENDADGLFNKQLGDDLRPLPGSVKGKAVWLIVDLQDTGKFSALAVDHELVNASQPFILNGKTYVAQIPPDGSTVKLVATDRVPPKAGTGTPAIELRVGSRAPEFTVEGPGGKSITLGSYAGKIVLVDFWATWCGPCQRAMPHLERVYQAAKDRGVVVLGVCSWDSATAYRTWLINHREQYTFTFGFDPAAKDTPGSIAIKQYGAKGLPSTYLIGPDGKIAGYYGGYLGEDDRRIEAGLARLGVTIP